MRRLCFLLVFLFLALFVYAANVPSPVGWVNDFAGVIIPDYKEKLNSLIDDLEQKTTAEIAVVTIDSISPYGEIEYARMLFDNWKPGKKGKDNGALVLLAVKERRWRIETGYGVEGILPDGLCGEIGRNYMVPYFKEGKFAEGLYYGTAAIAKVIAKDANVKLTSLEDFKELALENGGFWIDLITPPAPIIFLLFVIGFLILYNYSSCRLKKDGYRYGGWGYTGGSWGGGVGGGFGGGGFGGGGFGGGGGGGGGAGGGF